MIYMPNFWDNCIFWIYLTYGILNPATREEVLTWNRPGSIGVNHWDKATYPFMSLSLFLTIFNPYTKTKKLFLLFVYFGPAWKIDTIKEKEK